MWVAWSLGGAGRLSNAHARFRHRRVAVGAGACLLLAGLPMASSQAATQPDVASAAPLAHSVALTVANHAPLGAIDSATATANAITVTGWALDPDTTASIQVHVYVDGNATATANLARPDVGVAYGLGNDHGYAVTVPASAGTHTVCTYGIDTSGGTNPLLACRTVTVTNNPPPFGNLESATPTSDSVTVIGWALDPDTTASIQVRVYVDGTAAAAVTADVWRPDVDSASHMGAYHGFNVIVPVASGTHQVCVSAINTPVGDNPTLGCRTVSVS